jgi:hypothetical protein
MMAALCAHHGGVMMAPGAFIQPNINTYAQASSNCPHIVCVLPRFLRSFELHCVEEIADGGLKKNLASCCPRANLSCVTAF